MSKLLNQASLPGELTEVGGKAANLHFLGRNGIPVPPWFCLSASCHAQLLAPFLPQIDELLQKVNYSSKADLATLFKKICEIHENLLFSKELEQAVQSSCSDLGNSTLFAVRSSALAEDSASDSFAGLFETFLYVSGADVVSHIKQVWASAYSPRALSYVKKKGLQANTARMGVVVQQMIPATRAGVMFSANPVGRLTEVAITAGYGVGEGIVSDQVETDTFLFDRLGRTIQKKISEKIWQVTLNQALGQGTVRIPIDTALGTAPVLEDSEVRGLAALAVQIETLYGREQDIEWAMDAKNGIFITQSRPVTTIPTGPIMVYDNSNVIESFPGIVSHLTHDTARSAYRENFTRTVIRAGVPRRLVENHPEIFANLIERIQGRVYYNLTNWQRMMMLLPGLDRFLIQTFQDMIGAAESKTLSKKVNPVQQVLRFAGLVAFYVPWSLKFTYRYLTLSGAIRAYEGAFAEIYERYRKKDLTTLTNQEIYKSYCDFVNEILLWISHVQLNDVFLMILFALTKKAVTTANSTGKESFNALFCGTDKMEGEMESVKPIRAILALADSLKNNPVLSAQIRGWTQDETTQDLEVLLRSLATTDDLPFIDKFREYLNLYGDRSLEELKQESRSFRDNPKQVLRLILGYSLGQLNSNEMASKELNLRCEAEKKLYQSLKGSRFKRLVIQTLVKHTRRLLVNRERARMDRARIVGEARRHFMQLGVGFAREKMLTEPCDILQMNEHEIRSLLESNLKPEEIQSRIARRKQEDESFRKLKPEARLFLKQGGHGYVTQEKVTNPENVSGKALCGVGCSVGVVRGRAAVIHNPNDAIDLKGRILVTEMTDPGWVFLMINSAGLVVEKGSLLSHTAIIGRELGIPTVVGVSGATRLIADGALIQINGSTGEIEIL